MTQLDPTARLESVSTRITITGNAAHLDAATEPFAIVAHAQEGWWATPLALTRPERSGPHWGGSFWGSTAISAAAELAVYIGLDLN